MINVLHLGLSYRCNMNCKHCFVVRKEDRLQDNDYYNIIDTLYDEGLFIVYYTFGEPLCSELFAKVSLYAKEKGMVQILMTNGSLVDEEKIKVIKENQINKVCISLDHIVPEKHDDNRNHKNSYIKAIEAIKILVENDVHTEISVTVNNNNVECLQDIYDLAKELNVEFISCLRERKNGKLIELENEEVYTSFFRNVLINQCGINVMFHDVSLLPILNNLKDTGKINDSLYERYYEMNCCHCKYTLSIEPNGDVGKCNLINRIIGNVFEKPLINIIEDEVEMYDDIICCSTIS